MSTRANAPAADPGTPSAPVVRRFRVRTRFAAIWLAMLGLNTGAGIMVSGALTLFAVALYSGLQPIRRVWANVRGVFEGRAATVKAQ
jgi:hypothetical protein